MKRFLIFYGIILLVGAALVALAPNSEAQALPEYSAQTGEPCSTCHLSPSGGGPRGPRGQAWVASSKPGAVPDLVQSLELLGVELSIDPAYFRASEGDVPEAEALRRDAWQGQPLVYWLNNYEGN
jgi:hypothetical protein